MAKTRLCVDINCGQINGVLIRYDRKSTRAIKAFTIDNPGYDFYKGSIYEIENIAEEIKFSLSYKKINVKELIVCTNHQDMVLEEAIIPVAQNGIYKDHAVRLENRAKQESKVPLKATYLKSQILIDTSNMANIVTVLMPQYIVEKCKSLASYLNMKLVGIADSGVSSCLAYKPTLKDKTFVVDLREDGTYVYFVDSGIIRAKEFVPFKSSAIVKILQKHKNCKSFPAAAQMLQDDMIILTAQRQNNDPYKKISSETFELVQSLSKMLDLTMQKLATRLHTDFKDVVLVGIGASFSGMATALSNKLKVPVSVLTERLMEINCSDIEYENFYHSATHDVLASSANPDANLLWIDNYKVGKQNSLLDIIYRFLFGE